MEAQVLHDIVVDILLRLPYKSLMRFKCTCKSWRDLILCPQFNKALLNLSDECNDLSLWRYGVLITRNTPHPSIKLYTTNAEASKRDLVRFDHPLEHCSDADILCSCNGMLLIDLADKDTLVLWNPSTGNYKEIGGYRFDRQGFMLWGLCYDSISDDYIVIKIYRELSPPGSPPYGAETYESTSFSVYSLKPGRCRANDDWHSYGYELISDGSGTLVKGAPHWVVNRSYKRFKKFWVDRVIIYFDPKEESKEKVFKEVPLPEWLGKNFKFELGVLRDVLCIVHNNNAENYFEIWAMKEYGVKESWIRFLIIPQPFQYMTPLCFTKNGEIIMEINRNKLVIYNIEGNTYKTVLLCENYWRFKTTTYAESSVIPRGRDK